MKIVLKVAAHEPGKNELVFPVVCSAGKRTQGLVYGKYALYH